MALWNQIPYLIIYNHVYFELGSHFMVLQVLLLSSWSDYRAVSKTHVEENQSLIKDYKE